jgi:asparagine synthase (glutamine-hydrolysing)
MCGLAGIARSDQEPVEPEVLIRMASAIWHRGPDGFGLFSGGPVGLAHRRLSIIDLAGGAQPLTNEDGRLLVVYNGEIYNYRELQRELEGLGHQFRTHCDTEVLVHGYEEWGEAMLSRLNGQFAFALYDRSRGSLLLARDRFGVRPLFYAQKEDGSLYFASEIKAILASGEVEAAPDPQGLDEVFSFWAARAPRTPFAGISALEPGALLRWKNGRMSHARYYDIDYRENREEPGDVLEQLDELMRSSVNLRMRADVPVGGYLSGGLDSSITCALAATQSPHDLRTFSVSFTDPVFDEAAFQKMVAGQLRSRHAVQSIGQEEIGEVFPDVIFATETPLVRTAPAPLYLLSRLTRDSDIKVVLTGEGADEFFLGYDLFKETQVRRFCLRRPESKVRPQLLSRLYPYLDQGAQVGEFWSRFFLDAGPESDPLFSHLPRFNLTERIKDFYSAEMRAELTEFDARQELRDSLPAEFESWSPLNRAAYLEVKTLLASYLLSSQGDRMGMAHSVEGRFPFLDHRLFEFAANLPGRTKLAGLREKQILRRWAKGIVPPAVQQRPKQPYRSPDVASFFGAKQPDYVRRLLDPGELRKTGFWDSARVSGLVKRCQSGRATGFRENQALVAVLSTQIWYDRFVASAIDPIIRHSERPDVHLTAAEPVAV